ncbi:S1 family peptidase [Nitrobacter winogradskyi]|uniref:S1-C subfamily serine protease n=1 Tax=Nitrobacter winogradskyi TaxID=913 RepID=A0ACC6ALZ5_NITWI|nr:serine protease [Nitrobacter winogradskyi]MCP2000890.1 S1-C subfamily serine protease [Nitrobacter winogradskyi]
METISFEHGEFIPAPDHGLLPTSIMPVIHLHHDKAQAIGTCFAISSDGLCLTARHVVEEALPGPVREGKPNSVEDGWLYVLYVSSEPDEDNPGNELGGLLPVHSVHFNGQLDIAALQIQLLRNVKTNELLKMPANRLGLGLPSIGETSFALGYHSMEWSVDTARYIVNQKLYGSRGLVEEIHCPQRDAVVAPFPRYRTSARYDPGMSGGPVFGLDGLVRGVVCSSYEGIRDRDGYISYASLVGPAALLQVEQLDESGNIAKYFIGDLITRKIVWADETGIGIKRLPNELRLRLNGWSINSVMGS